MGKKENPTALVLICPILFPVFFNVSFLSTLGRIGNGGGRRGGGGGGGRV